MRNFDWTQWHLLLCIVVVGGMPLGASAQVAGGAKLQAADSAKPQAAGAKWDAYVETFLNDYFVAHPDIAVQAGRHEFDGQLPDWSEAGLRREVEPGQGPPQSPRRSWP